MHSISDVTLFSVDTYNRTPMEAARLFAEQYWDAPRGIATASIPEHWKHLPYDLEFTVRDGKRPYFVCFSPTDHKTRPDRWVIYTEPLNLNKE